MDRESIMTGLLKLPLWGDVGIDCGIRAGFRCEYCDRDLLASLDDYKAWAQDHIVPRKHGGSDDIDNMAVACHPCNSSYKRDWDPRESAGPNATRDELTAATRAFIAEKRSIDQANLDEARRLTEWSPPAA